MSVKFRLFLAPLLLISSLWVANAAATSVRPLPMESMVAVADVIFHGRVVSNQVILDPVSGRVATLTQFEVIESIKGAIGQIHTIKQIGGRLPESKVRLAVHGVPQFESGEAYVVFLPKASSLGFSSPIGLAQGKFDVLEHGEETTVSNGRPMAALMATSAQKTPTRTPTAVTVDIAPSLKTLPGQPTRAYLTDFLQTVRGMTEE